MFIHNQRGFTLIELIVTLVLLGIVVTGFMLAVNENTQHSADTLLRKQALTLAESQLENIEAQLFSTYPITPVSGVNGFNGFTVASAITPTTVGGVPGDLITVTVTDPHDQSITLTGFRTNHP